MPNKEVVISIARTDGQEFTLRNAWVGTDPLEFKADNTARISLPRQSEKYQMPWIVTGDPGEYQVQITAPPEAADAKANARKRKIDLDGFGAGQRRFSVNP